MAVEQEATVLRSRISALESENEKLRGENKQLCLMKNIVKKQKKSQDKQGENGVHSEIENETRQSQNLKPNGTLGPHTVAKDGLYGWVKSSKRTPRKPTLAMTKDTLKKMVEDLEKEIADMNDGFQKYESNLLQEIAKLKDSHESIPKLEELKRQFDEQISLYEDVKKKLEKENAILREQNKSFEKEKSRLEDNLNQAKEFHEKECSTMEEEYRKEISMLKSELEAANADLNTCRKNNEQIIANVRHQFVEQKRKAEATAEELKSKEEQLTSLRQSVDSLSLQVAERSQKTSELEKVLNNMEEKCENLNKLLQAKNKEVADLEMEIERVNVENSSLKLIEKKESNYKSRIEELENQINEQATILSERWLKIQQLEKALSSSSSENPANSQLKTLNEKMAQVLKEKKKGDDEAQTKVNNLQKEVSCQKTEIEKLQQRLMQTVKNESFKLEYEKLKSMYDLKVSEYEQMKNEMQIHLDQLSCLKKENEELHQKLDDYNKVSKVQRNMIAETSGMEDELRELRTKLYNEEQGRKVEVAALKVRYENHVAAITNQLQGVQSQLFKFKEERDNYKRLLEEMQRKADAEQTVPATISSSSTPNNSEEIAHAKMLKSQTAHLEQQLSCAEDQLLESRVECSKLKTELVSARSAWEVKLAEMTSRINQLEEERVLYSGRSKMPGLKTRLELAWQKERQEQSRLLQETSTLARDLRQTLFEVEREREKELLEAKRRLSQMKKNMEEEQEELKKKLNEMQRDILELRDAHAKLRTTNEKLRREKERLEKEKQQSSRYTNAGDKRQQDDCEQRRMAAYIMELISKFSNDVPTVPDRFASVARSSSVPPESTPPALPARKKTISKAGVSMKERDNNPLNERSFPPNEIKEVEKEEQSKWAMQKLLEVIKQYLELTMSINDLQTDYARKSFVSKRSSSTETDRDRMSSNRQPTRANMAQRAGSLRRKCISLEQTIPKNDMEIWKDEDEETDGSLSSFQSYEDSNNSRLSFYGSRNKESNSRYDELQFDSRLSNSSTKSEIVVSSFEKNKKNRRKGENSGGIFGKLKKKLTSSRSADNSDDDAGTGFGSSNKPPFSSSSSCQQPLNVGSNSSLRSSGDHQGKGGAKRRFANMFKSSSFDANR